MSSSVTYVAWDIETCPRPTEELSDAHLERHEKESRRRAETSTEPTDEDRSKAASLHPMLGWICCISAVAGDVESGYRGPRSWTAGSQEEEEDLLREFWNDVEALENHVSSIRWVTFFGKQFDVPFVSVRSVRHGIRPTSKGLLSTHKYRDEAHLDLANVWQAPWYSLADLCDHLGVESPKGVFDGSDAAPAVRNGRINAVRDYCERDVVATFRCVEALVPFLN